jgi:hypothetical protein
MRPGMQPRLSLQQRFDKALHKHKIELLQLAQKHQNQEIDNAHAVAILLGIIVMLIAVIVLQILFYIDVQCLIELYANCNSYNTFRLFEKKVQNL